MGGGQRSRPRFDACYSRPPHQLHPCLTRGQEFGVAVWNYATFDDEGLRRFAFEMYDTDCGGALEPSEIKHMFQEVCGDDFAR